MHAQARACILSVVMLYHSNDCGCFQTSSSFSCKRCAPSISFLDEHCGLFECFCENGVCEIWRLLRLPSNCLDTHRCHKRWLAGTSDIACFVTWKLVTGQLAPGPLLISLAVTRTGMSCMAWHVPPLSSTVRSPVPYLWPTGPPTTRRNMRTCLQIHRTLSWMKRPCTNGPALPLALPAPA